MRCLGLRMEDWEEYRKGILGRWDGRRYEECEMRRGEGEYSIICICMYNKNNSNIISICMYICVI